MKKTISIAAIATFALLTAGSSYAQTTGPSGQDTTTKGTDTMSKDGMKGGAMAPSSAPKTNDASKSGAASATSAEKGMTSKGSSTMSK